MKYEGPTRLLKKKKKKNFNEMGLHNMAFSLIWRE